MRMSKQIRKITSKITFKITFKKAIITSEIYAKS